MIKLPASDRFERNTRFACSPGPIGTLFGIEDPATNPGVPSPGDVSGDYLNLIRGYAGGLPTLLNAENRFKPGFVNTALNAAGQTQGGLLSLLSGSGPALSAFNTAANTASRSSNINDVSNLGGAAAAAVGAIDPANADLVHNLTRTANTELAAGTRLDPNALRQITQGTRADWASRGLGNTQPAMLDEAVQEAVGGQNLLAQREAAATNAVNTAQTINAPAFSLLTDKSGVPGQAFNLLGNTEAFSSGAGPTVINPASAYDTFNTAYNARSAANIAHAQNAAALDSY